MAMTRPVVRIETVQLDASGRRQIGPRTQTTALLQERASDIQAAVAEAWHILSASAAATDERDDWHVSSFEATFGITLSVEAGAIISKVGAEASLEVHLTIERRQG
jgi:hypothetical protein